MGTEPGPDLLGGYAAPPPLLGGYAAKRCPVRTQIDFHPLIPTQRWEPNPQEQARLVAGVAVEAEAFAALADLHPASVLVDPALRHDDAVAATLAAMDAAAPLILGGWLPDDPDGGRAGKPDILIRTGGGYLPADVKNHRTLKPATRTTATLSPLGAPADVSDAAGLSAATGHRFDDGMQLAHYTRMLQACRRHAGPLRGAILGNDLVDGTLVLTWHDLDVPVVTTFSRSAGKKKRPLLEHYDHQHAFRVAVAGTAMRIVGGPDDPEPLVRPVGQKECDSCPHQQWCAQEMGAEDPSAAITTRRLGAREYLALRRFGVGTTAALAAVDVDDPQFFEPYFAEVCNLSRRQARSRLAGAVQRARMICDGVELIRAHAVPIPSAGVEIDVDIENDPQGRVYLWGARIRDGDDESTARYVSFADWEPLDSERERNLARRFVAWLREQCAAATAARRSVAVFHWSDPEVSKLRSILGLAEVGDLIDPQTGIYVDLLRVFDAGFVSLHGSSLKTVAGLFGFAWAVEDPGGAVSQLYLSKVHTGDPGEAQRAKAWLLSYNADDTAATAAVRDGMRQADGCSDTTSGVCG